MERKNCRLCLASGTTENHDEHAVPDPKPPDLVNHPSHYNAGKIEVIEFIEDQRLGYHLGNALKYICRAGKKGDGNTHLIDLRKAIWYINREIEIIEAARCGMSPRRPNDMNKEKQNG